MAVTYFGSANFADVLEPELTRIFQEAYNTEVMSSYLIDTDAWFISNEAEEHTVEKPKTYLQLPLGKRLISI